MTKAFCSFSSRLRSVRLPMSAPMSVPVPMSAALAFGLAFVFGLGEASAQYLSPGETVRDRARPELDAKGMRAGGFMLFPTLDLEEAFDDNIFKADNGTVDDYILSLKPALSVNSQWSRHALNFLAGAETAFYADNDDENYTDYNFSADGRVDIRRDTHFEVDAGFSQNHEDRGSPDDANGVDPGEYTRMEFGGSFSHRFNRVSIEPLFKASQLDYDDVRTSSGSTVNNDDRDRDEFSVGSRLGYMIVPDKYEAFVRFTYNQRDYDANLDDNGFNRDSDGFEAVVGTAIDFGGVTFGDVYVGYTQQKYDDAALKKIDGLVIGGSIFWNPTALTTINPFVTRSIEETTVGSASGYLNTTVGVNIDHELRRNFLLHGAIRFSSWEYEGVRRTDDYIKFSFGGEYLMSRYARLELTYELENRSSDAAGSDFTQNRVILRGRVQL